MSADPFRQYADGADPAVALRQARKDALGAHDYGGYTGTVAEKNNYVVITDRPMTRRVTDTGHGVPPFGCAHLTVRRNLCGPSTAAVPDGWLFFSWASS